MTALKEWQEQVNTLLVQAGQAKGMGQDWRVDLIMLAWEAEMARKPKVTHDDPTAVL